MMWCKIVKKKNVIREDVVVEESNCTPWWKLIASRKVKFWILVRAKQTETQFNLTPHNIFFAPMQGMVKELMSDFKMIHIFMEFYVI